MKPSLDETFPILVRIHEVPLDLCKAGYDRVDQRSHGEEIDTLNKFAPCAGSTREFIAVMFAEMPPVKYDLKYYEDVALAVEYIRRTADDLPSK